MKSIRQWIIGGLVASAVAATSAFAGQTFNTTSPQNGTNNETFYLSVPSTCSISSVAGLNNPIQPSGGGGAGITVTLINITTVYSFGYGSNMTGSASRSASGQAAGYYKIDHNTNAGGSGVSAYATTTFNW